MKLLVILHLRFVYNVDFLDNYTTLKVCKFNGNGNPRKHIQGFVMSVSLKLDLIKGFWPNIFCIAWKIMHVNGSIPY